ncbi:uncharacterized protein LOC129716757 [Wyeomyia smithii]|uniref:uncharacterized protein LOC129716757 n=1 Tax=Wyeomyia smithii TaxID=174621 RepID=UPI002467C334|nr:uncharacterized protein LOC129716757 [Wyeomyia smithii]
MQWDKIGSKTNINLDMFLELIEFCVKNSFFYFRGQHFRQVFGTAMGNPLSPILADIVMDSLMQTVIKKLPFAIPIVRKYVDDLFIALPRQHIQFTLDAFNAYNEHLKFTKEEEQNAQLPFLDLTVIRYPDQTLRTQWYAKPMASGRILNYHSFHQLTMKINVAQNFIERVIKLTSTDNSTQWQRNTIFEHLRRNNYPPSLINRLINRCSNAMKAKTLSNTATPSASNHCTPVNTETTYRSLPFIPKLTTAIVKHLQADFPHLKITQKPIETVSNIVKTMKDPIEPLLQPNVVYSLPCNDCHMQYIGMTRNQLKTRLYGHKSNINQYKWLIEDGANSRDNSMVNLEGKTAMMEHIIKHQHMFDLTKVEIIDISRHTWALPMLEMCHIANTDNTVNHRNDIDGINTAYAGILHTIKNYTRRRSNTQHQQTTPSSSP